MQKHPLDSTRLRRVPAHFSWVDHRLIRQRLLRGVRPNGWALYLFLVAVGDEQGLSYYSDRSISEHLDIPLDSLAQARRDLLGGNLIAWEAPLYQVLDLSNARPTPAPQRSIPTARARPCVAIEPMPEMSDQERRAQGQRLAQTFCELLKGGAQ